MNITYEAWRAQVEKELAGTPFDKALVHATAEGIAVQPLYTSAPGPSPAPAPGCAPFVRGASADPAPFAVCMRHARPDPRRIAEDLAEGADAVWLDLATGEGIDAALDAMGSAAADAPNAASEPGSIAAGSHGGGRPGATAAARGGAAEIEPGSSASLAALDPRRPRLVLEAADPAAAMVALTSAHERLGAGARSRPFVLAVDPVSRWVRGRLATPQLGSAVSTMARAAKVIAASHPGSRSVLISTTAYHDAGADAADEIAISLATGVVYLEALLAAGLGGPGATRQIALRLAIGRDTFVELAKLRALRLVWHKLLAASGAPEAPPPLVHAVASARTMTVRDPWVNMLRGTTQLFAAILGGADLVTPLPFDDAAGDTSALGHRAARNAGLVLREESHLGRVVDAAGGSYYLETLTDQLARESWRRFQEIEKAGGLIEQLTTGTIQRQISERWSKRTEAFAKRRDAIVGVSEFANLDEPPPVRHSGSRAGAHAAAAASAASSAAGTSSEPGTTCSGSSSARQAADGAASGVPGPGEASGGSASGASSARHSVTPSESAPDSSTSSSFLAPLPIHRDSEAFEALRDTADALASVDSLPVVTLVTLGPPAEFRARVGFASAFFAVGGLRSAVTDVPTAPGPIACLCGSDERYASEAAATAAQLRASGARHIYLAGRPGALEPALREAGVTGFLFLGCDTPRILGDLLGGLA